MKIITFIYTAEYGRHSAHFYSLLYPMCAVLSHLYPVLYICVQPWTFGFLSCDFIVFIPRRHSLYLMNAIIKLFSLKQRSNKRGIIRHIKTNNVLIIALLSVITILNHLMAGAQQYFSFVCMYIWAISQSVFPSTAWLLGLKNWPFSGRRLFLLLSTIYFFG